jgi:hypothetical protein
MKDYITLGSTPSDEPCASVGEPITPRKLCRSAGGFSSFCARHLVRSRKARGSVSSGSRTTSAPIVRWSNFDTGIEESVEYALRCEAEMPATWEDV